MNTFLTLFLSFYGNVSVQLFPVSFHRPKSIFNLLWNFLLIFTCNYRIYQFHVSLQEKDPRIILAFQEKPLFSMLYNDMIIVQASFLLNSAYFILINCQQSSRLLPTLSFCLSKLTVFKSTSSSKKIFITLIVAHQIIFFFTILQTLILYIKKRNYWFLLLDYVQFFLINTNNYMPAILTHLYKFCIVRLLRKSIKKYKKEGGKNIQKLENELKQLAAISSQLNEHLSLPLLCLLVPFTSELLLTLSYLWLKRLNFVDTYLLQFVLHLGMLAYGEVAVQGKLKEIKNIMRNHYTPNKLKLKLIVAPIRNLELMSSYQSQFKLSVFSLFTVNFAFIFALSLFVLNYLIFIMQTTF